MISGAAALPRWAWIACVVVSAAACDSLDSDTRTDGDEVAPQALPPPSAGAPARADATTVAGSKADGARSPAEAGKPASAAGSGGVAGAAEANGGRNAAAAAAGANAAAAGGGGDDDEPDAGTGSAGASSESCTDIRQLDLLFVVDNSNSMAGEQAALKRQFPAIIQALSSGQRPGPDGKSFPAVQDMHVGVVSTDMGIPGVEFPSGNCRADGGDDGRLRSGPAGQPGCDASYPSFLSYQGPKSGAPVTDPAKFSNDVSCLASLGTGGCGFEQQLEAPFKALWPKVQMDAAGNVITPTQYRFLSTTEQGTWGRGDLPLEQGGNLGFLRNGRDGSGPSLIAVVLLTDEEDCSVRSTDHLKPNNQLPEDSPYRMQDINLRCYYNKQSLFDVKSRYYDGLRKLRPGREELVLFAAITGVPVDLVGPDALAKVDFESDDPSSRDKFFDAVLNDARMQETLDPLTNPGSGQGNLKPSCSRMAPGEAQPSTAYPPRRIVELAKHFGKNGMVQSICQDDFTVASSAVIDSIARRLERPCPR